MGKAQSKRSVDITTETKKGAEDEVTEKMEKIEDLDKKEVVNGDATITEKSDPEKKISEDVENDKDMTTEKEVDVQASGDSEPQNTAETSKEEGGSATTEDISPLADESIKKSKKEKVKKKWSFRSISFGKKDKQKPAKNEDAPEEGTATNGADTDEKTITEPEDSQQDKIVNENEEKTAETKENGNATPQEINGEQSEEKAMEEKSNDITTNTTNNTTTTESCEPVQNETAAVSSELSEKTENTANTSSIINENNKSENATIDDASKNGNGVDEKINTTEPEPQKIDVTNASVESPSEKISALSNDVTYETQAATNGEVVEKIHQNGDHDEPEQEVEISKAQIEVNTNTDNNVSDATLDSISSTSINPSYDQIQDQDLNASREKSDELIHVDKNESSIQNPTNIEIKSHTVEPSPLSGIVASTIEKDVESNVEIETAAHLASDIVPSEKSPEDKNDTEPSPPPLPISPPPSQVSVFAFTNDESVEDSIQNKNSEPTINSVVEEEMEEILPTASELPKTENNISIEIDTVEDPIIKEEIIPSEQTTESHVDDVYKNVKHECDEIKEVEENASVCQVLPLCEENVPSSTGISEESQDVEEVAVAVIDEITEKAAEIVSQQLIFNEEQLHDEVCLQSNEETQKYPQECNNDENIAIENIDNVQIDNDKDGEIEFESETTEQSRESAPELNQVNIKTECSLDSSAINSIQQEKDEMISVNKSDILNEELINQTKEFANAKDIKDNVIVAEITQDLSVTCE